MRAVPVAAVPIAPAGALQLVFADSGQHDAQALVGHDSEPSGLVRVYDDEPRFLGVGEVSEGGTIAPRRVFLAAEKKP